MADETKQPETGQPKPPRKACQIMVMFPVENDEDALAIKQAIDKVVGDIPEKRYNFSINEV